jgi:hypothetical protein
MTKQEKFRFWINWTLLSLGIIPLSYLISLIAVLLVHGAFGFSMTDEGTKLSQTLMQIAGGAVLGLGAGICQKSLLRRLFKVSSSWIYTLITGFAISELIICIILWQLDLNRYQLRFIEGQPLPEAIFFACAGLVVGLFQWTILKKHFSRSGYWILASTIGWGACLLPTIINEFAFIFGALLYGAITGAALIWLLQRRQEVKD